MPSVTVEIVRDGDDDDEWGDEEEVVVWSNDLHNDTNGGAAHSVDIDIDVPRGGGGHPRGLLVASLANLAISYNVVNIGLALKIMGELHQESIADESLVSAGAILGMMAGQIIFGAAGDCLGRQRALCYTLFVCFLGAAGSSTPWGPDIYQQLLYWRILLGVGAGGVYPLAAALARDSTVEYCARVKPRRATLEEGQLENEEEYTDTGSTAVALMFSMQGVGYLSAHLTGVLLLSVLPETSPLAWRLLLGLGAVLPLALVVMLASAFARARRYGLVHEAHDAEDGTGGEAGGGEEKRRGRDVMGVGGAGRGGRSSPARVWLALRDKKRLLRKLIGTAGSWFLFDVTFYGNQLYQEDVLEAVFGRREGPRQEAFQDSLLALVALPGYFVAVALIRRMGPRRMQVQGFVAMAFLFAIIGIAFKPLLRHAGMLMTLYSLTFFFSNFGPNSTTFMLPSLTFPDQVRGSLNGLSAAAGKLGALMGSLVFEPAAEAWGVGAVLVVCALFSLAGGALTLGFVNSEDEDGDLDHEHGEGGNAEEGLELSERATTNGNIRNGGGRMNGASVSPKPFRDHTPRKSAKSNKQKGTYSRVGENGGGHPAEFDDSNGAVNRQQGVFGDGENRYRDLAAGRAGGVEGQMEAGGGRWDGSSDSDSDGAVESVFVESVGATKMAVI